jgi:hypothetical protein
MTTKIVFIDAPKFEIDFRTFDPLANIEDQKTQNVAQILFKLIPVIMTSMVKASWVTLTYSGVSFKQNVLGFYGAWENFRPPSDIYLAAFKVAFWALGLVWCATTTTVRFVIQDLFPTTPTFLASYASKGINIHHIRTNESGIDVSGVEAHVSVNDLLTIYDQINFADPSQPGYMKGSSRQEYTTIYTVPDLRQALVTFVNQVNGRVAFLGTPPAYDTPRLMAFYSQIENAVRFSIDKMNKQIAEFQATNGTEISAYDEPTLKIYKGLLEDKARIAIDLAIAGKHCGARYMGEAMSVYGNTRGEDLAHRGTLQDSIFELLAKKRYEIACGQIQQHLDTDTHSFNKYMANLGQILGLPGTENIIEHLDRSFDRDRFLRLFFAEYTVDVIIETIQAEVKKSQAFREKITDWVKDQVGIWNEEETLGEVERLVPSVLEALRNPVASPNFELFRELAAHLRGQDDLELPTLEGKSWDDYSRELFDLDAVKDWRDQKFTDVDAIASIQDYDNLQPLFQRARIRAYKTNKLGELKELCSTPIPSQEELRELQTKNGQELLDCLVQRCERGGLIQQIHRIVRLETDTIARGLSNHELFRNAIASQQDVARRTDFMQALAEKHVATRELADDKHETTITPALMEWLTVSQGVFTTQVGG